VGMRTIRVRTGEYADHPDHIAPWRSVPDVVAAVALMKAGLRDRRRRTAP
jgi:hypothetical protein